jgi:hypothetical protein
MSTQFTNRQWRLPNNENKDKQSNYSMDFDSASSDFIQASLSTSSFTSFAISAWVYADSLGSYNGVASQFRAGSTTTSSWFLETIGSNMAFGIANGSALQYTSKSFTTLAWHHIVGVWDGTQIEVYVDGVASGSPKSVSAMNTNTVDLGIGGIWNSAGTTVDNGLWNGKIDAVAIFNYALSQGQITTLYGSSSTGIGNPMSLSPKPVAYYPLGDQDAFNGANYLVPNSSLKDYVFDFPGNGDNITIDNLFNFSGSDLCISIWYNSNSVVNYDYLLYRFGGSSVLNVYVLNNKLRYEIYAGSTRYRIEGNVVFDGNWHNSIMIFNDTAKTWTVYEDSVFVNTLTATASIDSATTSVYIGSYGGSTGNDYSGLVSNLVIWNSDQSSEKDNIYNNGTPASSYTNTPTGWWKLDASDTYDSSTGNWTIEDHAGSNDGTSSGMTQANLVVSDLSFKSGFSPYALDFDSASSDYINCGNVLNNIFTGSSFSVSTWIYATTNTTYNNFFNKGTTVQFYLHSNKIKIYLGSSSSGIWPLESTATLSLNTWYNIVFTRSVNENKLYINGSSDNSATSTGSIPSSTGDLTISSYNGGSSYFWDGSMSNVSVWNTALTSAQVTEIYNEGVPSNLNNHSAYSNLVSWWQLGSNSSFNTNWTVLDEVTASGNNGTSANMGEDAIVDGVGSYANGLSSGMGGDEVIGDAPYSTANSLSYNMDVLDRVEDTPS